MVQVFQVDAVQDNGDQHVVALIEAAEDAVQCSKRLFGRASFGQGVLQDLQLLTGERSCGNACNQMVVGAYGVQEPVRLPAQPVDSLEE